MIRNQESLPCQGVGYTDQLEDKGGEGQVEAGQAASLLVEAEAVLVHGDTVAGWDEHNQQGVADSLLLWW